MCLSCRSRKMLKNEYLVAKIGFDTAKNEPRQVLHFLAGKLEFNTIVDDRIRQLRFFCAFGFLAFYLRVDAVWLHDERARLRASWKRLELEERRAAGQYCERFCGSSFRQCGVCAGSAPFR